MIEVKMELEEIDEPLPHDKCGNCGKRVPDVNITMPSGPRSAFSVRYCFLCVYELQDLVKKVLEI